MWNLRVAAYCLMSSHYHILIQTPDGNLSRCMRHIIGVYAQRFNRSYLIEWQLFRGRYKSIPVEAERRFIERVRRKFYSKKSHQEVPESRFLSPDSERIKEEVCRSYGVDRVEPYASRRGISNEPGNVGVYLLRALRGDKLEEIVEDFNMNRCSSVSIVVEKMKVKISRNRQLRKRIEELKVAVYMSQE